jgi:Ran GTPase-activating protein (RanGAP) involved in mRNA processing and transport
MDRVPISFTNIFQAYPDLTELTIRKMTLGVTDLGYSRIEDLASVLAQNTTLTKLSLLSCGVDDISVQRLVNSLATNTNLEEIKLEVNKITDVGAQAMGELLKINKTLKTLSLMGNQAMTDAGISAVAQVLYDLPNPTLESLDVMGIPTQKTLQQQANLAAHLKLKNVTIKFN